MNFVKMNKQLRIFLTTILMASIGHGLNAQNDKPNFLWISVEDISPLFQAYGDSSISTPNISRLIEEGILFENAFATVGVCAPSRSSIITGMYPVSIGTHNMRTGSHYMAKSPEDEKYEGISGFDSDGNAIPQYAAVPPSYVKCFTEYLREGGYYTSNNFKTDYQFNSPFTAWDETSNQAHYRNRKEGQPFFAVFNHEITHESRLILKKNDPMLADKEQVKIPDYFPAIPEVKNDIGRVYSNIIELDKQVGELLDELKNEGVYENTIIFFWSDHGGPLLRQKRDIGDAGLRVPLIVKFPNGWKGGTREEQIVSLMDLGPTVLSLAEIKPPAHMHGKAFLGKFKDEIPHKYAFGSADRFGEAVDMRRSVIDGRFVYIKNFRPELPLVFRNAYREQLDMTKKLLEMDRLGELKGDHAYIFMKTKPIEELYDLKNDPYEVKNLAVDPEYREKLMEMRNALASWQLEVKDLGFVPERKLVELMWPGLIQPETKKVRFETNNSSLSLFSESEGASIGYHIEGKDTPGSWNLYFEPIPIVKGQKIKARAIRIGYKASEITSYEF